MPIRGIRGAITVSADQEVEILTATRELLTAILAGNPDLQSADIASAFFSVTEDLQAVFPALAARQIGWDLVPLLCSREIAVPGSMPLCVRVLIHWNTRLPQNHINHVYLKEAASLRPDINTNAKQKAVN